MAAGFAIFGIIACFTSPLGKKYLLILAAFVIPHAALFASARAAFPRNVLPITPAVAVLAGIAIAKFADAFKTGTVRHKVIVLTTAVAVFLPMRATILNDYVMTRPCTLTKAQQWFIQNAERVVRPGYRVASLHSLWTPRTVGGDDLSIGEIFVRHSSDESKLPDPVWFIQQGVVFFTIENWGVSRYGPFPWPARILRLVRRHCILVDTIKGWPPEPRWLPDHGFAAPKIGPQTYFGPTTEIYILQSHLLPGDIRR